MCLPKANSFISKARFLLTYEFLREGRDDSCFFMISLFLKLKILIFVNTAIREICQFCSQVLGINFSVLKINFLAYWNHFSLEGERWIKWLNKIWNSFGMLKQTFSMQKTNPVFKAVCLFFRMYTDCFVIS